MSWFQASAMVLSDIFSLLGFHDAQIGSYLPSFRDKPKGPIFKVQAVHSKSWTALTLENGADRLSRNVGD